MRLLYAFIATVLTTAVLCGADPKVIPVGGFVDHKIAVPENSSVVWRITPTPVQKANDLEPGRLVFGGKPGEKYVVTALTITVKVDFEKKTAFPIVTEADYEFQFAGSAPPTNPKDPPVTPTGLYLMVVRPDGPATARFTQTMGMAEWDTLRNAGHKVKDFAFTDSKPFVTLPANTSLPAVAVLEEGATTSKLLRVVPLPSTGAGILDLPK